MFRNVRTRTLLKYLVVQVPGWTIAVALASLFNREYALPWFAGLLLVGLWIAKDLVLYPRMRSFYESTPVAPRIVGERGIAVTDLAPRGFVRVYGELWQAEAADHARIADGLTVCVRDIRGLLLIVEPFPSTPMPPEPGGAAARIHQTTGARLITSNHPQSHSHREIHVTPGDGCPGVP